jgi:hypothetical protein
MDVVVEAEMADPVEAPVLVSFAGAIDSVETEVSRCSEVVARWKTVAASRHWLRLFSDRDRDCR